MVPGQGAASGARRDGSVGLAADGGAPGAARRASAAPRAPTARGAALLAPGGGAEEKRCGARPCPCRHAGLGSALAAAAAGAVRAAAAGGLLGVEQHLRSHARFLKRSSPNRAPSDVSAARLPRHPPPGPTFPPPTPSLLSRLRGLEAAGGARCRRVLSARALPPGRGFRRSAPQEGQGTPIPTPTPSRVLATQIREPKGTCFRRTQTDAQGPRDAARFL